MKYRLAGVRAGIDYRAVAGPLVAPLAGQIPCHHHQMTQAQPVFPVRVLQGLQVFLGDDQHVGRGFGVNVLECQGQVILEKHLGRDLLPNDLAEQAV